MSIPIILNALSSIRTEAPLLILELLPFSFISFSLVTRMSTVTTVFKEENAVGRTGTAIDQDRDTFLPRPSDDPNDPLNFPVWLKV